jgi:cyanophycinase
MTGRRRGALIIIGGGEDKDGRRTILKEVAGRVRNGHLVVATVASHEPQGYFEDYERAFDGLGVGKLTELYIHDRAEASETHNIKLIENADGVYFTGGDQLRITSQLGDTPVERALWHLYERGGLVAGTSAGASVMSETMLVGGKGGESALVGDVRMSPGLGFMPDITIDQHFAERGRLGRLLECVAQNPRVLGIGIDEDTAIVVEDDEASVIGRGAVYIIDGMHLTYSNVGETEKPVPLSAFDVKLHILSERDRYDLRRRIPHARATERT